MTREEAIEKAAAAAELATRAAERVGRGRPDSAAVRQHAMQAKAARDAARAWAAVARALPLDQEAETEAPQHETEYEIECPACDGSGHADPDDAFGTCEACNGTGWEGG